MLLNTSVEIALAFNPLPVVGVPVTPLSWLFNATLYDDGTPFETDSVTPVGLELTEFVLQIGKGVVSDGVITGSGFTG
jgi:hypothetical protein